MHQSKYTRNLLRRFNMQQSNLARTLAEVGLTLEKETDEELVLVQHRPDLSFSVGLISRFIQSHLLATKRILRYVQGTIGFEVLFPKGEAKAEPELIGYLIQIGVKTRVIEKASQDAFSSIEELQFPKPVVALSSCEAEYIATSETACQVVWLEALMKDLQVENLGKIKLLVDNKSTIDLARHPASHGRSKHIETRFYFLREQVNNEKLHFADILTKALKLERFRWLRDYIGFVYVNATLD
ncbi:Copia protein, partial [Mucuna pruriens]